MKKKKKNYFERIFVVEIQNTDIRIHHSILFDGEAEHLIENSKVDWQSLADWEIMELYYMETIELLQLEC